MINYIYKAILALLISSHSLAMEYYSCSEIELVPKFLEELPQGIFNEVLKYVDKKDINNLLLTNKKIYQKLFKSKEDIKKRLDLDIVSVFPETVCEKSCYVSGNICAICKCYVPCDEEGPNCIKYSIGTCIISAVLLSTAAIQAPLYASCISNQICGKPIVAIAISAGICDCGLCLWSSGRLISNLCCCSSVPYKFFKQAYNESKKIYCCFSI